jgi:hypothetical protein
LRAGPTGVDLRPGICDGRLNSIANAAPIHYHLVTLFAPADRHRGAFPATLSARLCRTRLARVGLRTARRLLACVMVVANRRGVPLHCEPPGFRTTAHDRGSHAAGSAVFEDLRVGRSPEAALRGRARMQFTGARACRKWLAAGVPCCRPGRSIDVGLPSPLEQPFGGTGGRQRTRRTGCVQSQPESP